MFARLSASSINQDNGIIYTTDVEEVADTEGVADVAEREERYALPEALKSLGEYDATRVRHIESSGKDRVVRNYDEIIEFIRRSKSNPPFERLHIGIISDKTAALVKARTGEDITGYDFVLASNFVFHIYDSHGNESTEAPRGQKAVDDVNIENIIEAVIAPDDVSLVSDTTGTALRFEKVLKGRNVAITITSTKKSTLTLKSAWIINEKSGGRTPSANANALAGTPEANSRNSTDTSIHESTEKINPSDEISSGISTDERLALSDTIDSVDIDGETRYNYTEQEYKDFGWARVNEVLSAAENERLRSLFADAVSGQGKYPQTKSGEYMIAIGEAVDNKIAYMTGTIDSPVITRVLEIDEYNETKLDELRRETYALERRGIQRKAGDIFYTHSGASFGGSVAEQRGSIQGERHNNQLGADRGRGSGRAAQAHSGARSPYLKVAQTFTDITGRKRNIIRLSDTEYMIEGDRNKVYYPSAEKAIEAWDKRISKANTSGGRRYALSEDTTIAEIFEGIETDENGVYLAKMLEYGIKYQKRALFMPKGNEGEEASATVPYLRSIISITELLENVKEQIGRMSFLKQGAKEICKYFCNHN